VIGAMTEGDRAYAEEQRKRAIGAAQNEDEVEFHPNVDRESKTRLLRGCTLLSVPAPYGESFGLYLLEALAAGVPCVQPRSGAFPEVLGATGGGVLVEPDNPIAMADAWEALLSHPERARKLVIDGREAVLERFSMDAMAGRFCDAIGIGPNGREA
jgi:glycosyltransferase involved in cell wall biosynthesis